MRSFAAAFGIGLVLALASGCGDSEGDRSERVVAGADPEARPAVAERDAWAGLRITGDEAEHYTTFEEMRDAADAVVVGVFTGFSPGRQLQGDTEEDRIWYIDGTVAVSEAIRGPWAAPTTIEVECLSGAPDEESLDADVAALESAVGTGEAVLFLREKGGDEAGLLRLVNSDGLVTATVERPVDVPLGDVVVGPTELSDPTARWPTLDDFVADLRT